MDRFAQQLMQKMQEGHADVVLVEVQRALERTPAGDRAIIALLLGIRAKAYLMIDNPSSAIDDLTCALDMHVDVPLLESMLYRVRAQARLGTGALKGAISDARAMLRIESSNPLSAMKAWYICGLAYLQLGNTADALESIENAFHLSESIDHVNQFATSILLHMRGTIRMLMYEYDVAIEYFTRAIDIHMTTNGPSFLRGLLYISRASAYIASKRAQLALSDVELCAIIMGRDVTVVMTQDMDAIRALAHLSHGHYDFAIEYASKLLGDDVAPLHPIKEFEVRRIRAIARFQMGEFSEAAVDISRAIELRATDKMVLCMGVMTYDKLGNVPAAVLCALSALNTGTLTNDETAIIHRIYCAHVLRERCILYFKLGNYGAARDFAKRALLLVPNDKEMIRYESASKSVAVA